MNSIICQKKYIILLYFLGHIQGLVLGKCLLNISPKYGLYFHEVFFKNRYEFIFITHNFVSGLLIGLLIQFTSVIFIIFFISYQSYLYIPTTWLYFGVSSGVLVSLFAISGKIVSIGFISPYIIILLIPHVLVFFTGTDAIAFLALNALKLLILYGFLLLFNYSLVVF